MAGSRTQQHPGEPLRTNRVDYILHFVPLGSNSIPERDRTRGCADRISASRYECFGGQPESERSATGRRRRTADEWTPDVARLLEGPGKDGGFVCNPSWKVRYLLPYWRPRPSPHWESSTDASR